MKAKNTKERPILFGGPMVQAILEGRKTQTRRIVKPQPQGETTIQCPYGGPGDLLWVREAWALRKDVDWRADEAKAQQYCRYRADNERGLDDEWHFTGGWRPSIHMPRCLSRLVLKIVRVRMERLQSITAEDAKREGCVAESFDAIWDSINGKGSWDSNPWVWAIEFKRIEVTHGG